MGYVLDGLYGKMTALKGTEIVPADLLESSKKRLVDPNSDLVEIRNALISAKYEAKEPGGKAV